MVILGGGDWTAQACDDIRAFAERWNLPVACSFRRQDLLDNRHRNYVGEIGIAISPELKKRVREADLILALGPRLGEMTTGGYTLFDLPRPRQRLVHVHPGRRRAGPRVPGRADDQLGHGGVRGSWRRACDAGAGSRVGQLDAAAAQRVSAEPRSGADARGAQPERGGCLAAQPAARRTASSPTAREISPAGCSASTSTPASARSLAPTNGAMGYGVPAAVAAKLTYPDRTVVCFSGDGDFLMTGQELATAVQFGAAVIFLVVNNGMYGTIRMHQERDYPARTYGTALRNPDFAAAGARLWSARSGGGEDGPVRAGVRRGGRLAASRPCSSCASIRTPSPRAPA